MAVVTDALVDLHCFGCGLKAPCALQRETKEVECGRCRATMRLKYTAERVAGAEVWAYTIHAIVKSGVR